MVSNNLLPLMLTFPKRFQIMCRMEHHLICRTTIMELKWKKDLGAEALTGLADEALAQIDKMRYDTEMKEDGIQDILKFGIAFSGKKVNIKTK